MELSSRSGEESMCRSIIEPARQRVIDAVQEHFNVTLQPVGKRPKWLRDKSDRNWWVLVGKSGKENWCGIPKVMMKNEEQTHIAGEGMLVIAQLKREVIEAFCGRLGPLVDAKRKNKLYPPRQGKEAQYQFTVRPCGDYLRIDKINVELERFARIPYSDEDKQKDKK